MKKCRIVGGGDFSPEIFKKNTEREKGFVIAADSGYKYLTDMNIIPDLTIGDFDSLGFIPENCPVITLPVEKNDTDISAAIKEGVKRGFVDFEIYGALGGGRISHTVANIQLLSTAEKYGAKAVIYDGKTTLTALSSATLSFSEERTGSLSVFALTDKISVKISGTHYDYEGLIENSFPLGVSNSFIGKKASVTVLSGTALIITEEN